MIVKMWLQLLLYCEGCTRSMWRWANRRWGMGIGCGSRRVWRWILLRWLCRQDFSQLVMLLARLRQTNLEDTRCREASLLGWEMLCKCKKNDFGILLGQWDEKLSQQHRQPGVEHLLVGKQVWGMNRRAKAAFLHSRGLQKFAAKSLPWNRTVLEMKPQERIIWTLAPLSKGPDGRSHRFSGSTICFLPRGPAVRVLGMHPQF